MIDGIIGAPGVDCRAPARAIYVSFVEQVKSGVGVKLAPCARGHLSRVGFEPRPEFAGQQRCRGLDKTADALESGQRRLVLWIILENALIGCERQAVLLVALGDHRILQIHFAVGRIGKDALIGVEQGVGCSHRRRGADEQRRRHKEDRPPRRHQWHAPNFKGA